MLKLYRDNKDQPELWESFLPPALKQIPEELALVDEALGDKKFVSRFEKKLLVKLQEEEISSHLGRPTVPLATYIRITSLKGKLKEAISLTEIVANQTKQVFRGNYHLPKRIVSIFDPQARPIIKGKVSPKTEFGRTVLIQEAEVPLITNYKVFEGVPGDAAQVIPAVKKHRKIFGRSPKEIAGDRGCYNKEHENLLHRLGVKHVSIPARGNRDPTCKEKEHTFWFKRLQRWRAGSEALISLLKRKFGLSRSLFRGTPGTATWVGYTVFAYNLWEMAKLNSS